MKRNRKAGLAVLLSAVGILSGCGDEHYKYSRSSFDSFRGVGEELSEQLRKELQDVPFSCHDSTKEYETTYWATADFLNAGAYRMYSKKGKPTKLYSFSFSLVTVETFSVQEFAYGEYNPNLTPGYIKEFTFAFMNGIAQNAGEERSVDSEHLIFDLSYHWNIYRRQFPDGSFALLPEYIYSGD